MEFIVGVRGGGEEAPTVSLGPADAVTVGRSSDCDLELSHDEISRTHCRLHHEGDSLHLVDLDSTNGTWIDGEQVDEAVLRHGDSFSVGPILLECRSASGPEQPSAPEGTARMQLEDAGAAETVYRTKVDPDAPWSSGDESPDGEELDELRRARRNFDTAFRVSRLLARGTELESLLPNVLDAVFQTIDAERAAVLLGPDSDGDRNPDPGQLRAVAARREDGDGRGGAAEELSVSRTVIADVLENGVSVLSHDATEDARFEGAESVIAEGIRSVVCAPLQTDERIIGVLYADSRRTESAFSEGAADLLALIGHQAGLAIRRARLAAQMERFFFNSIRAIVATIDAKDGYTHGHSERVAAYATRIAEEVGVGEDEELETVRLSGLLHDIGKIAVPDAILNKEGDLTEKQYAMIRKHPLHGERILGHIENPRFKTILPGVRHHHERWDGTGYPDGLAGEEIPFLGRLLAVADVVDALSSDRSYREAYSLSRAVEIVEEDAGAHFDPELADAAASLHDRGELEVTRQRADTLLGGLAPDVDGRRPGGSAAAPLPSFSFDLDDW